MHHHDACNFKRKYSWVLFLQIAMGFIFLLENMRNTS
jgi:hypothetical protein